MPNNFLDVTGTSDRIIKRRRDAPAQGLSMVEGDIAQKVVVSPMKFMSRSIGGTLLPAKRNVRYLIHSAIVSAANTAESAGTYAHITGTVGGVSMQLLHAKLVPNVANVVTVVMDLDILTDSNKLVDGAAVGIIGTGYWGVSYQEVFEYDY